MQGAFLMSKHIEFILMGRQIYVGVHYCARTLTQLTWYHAY